MRFCIRARLRYQATTKEYIEFLRDNAPASTEPGVGNWGQRAYAQWQQSGGMVPVEMLGLTEFPRIGELPYFLTLGPYSFYWFRLQQAAAPITARVAPETSHDMPEVPALFVGAAWDTLLEGNVRTLIERDLLVPFLLRQRWYGAKARRARSARFADWGILRRGPQPLFLTIVEVEYQDGGRDRYFLPLAICATADARPLQERTPHAVLAAVTGARKGLLFDAWLDDRFGRTLLEAIAVSEQVRTRRGTVRARDVDARGDGRRHRLRRAARYSH